MANAKELKRVYDMGEFNKCLQEIQKELTSRPDDDSERGELLALEGWCYYRKGDHEIARKYFQEAGQVNFAREGLAYLAVYIDKDDVAFMKLAQELGDLVNIQNALIIRARDSDSIITSEQVINAVFRFRDNVVEVANLYHNAGRFFLAKARDDHDLIIALWLLDVALARYGDDHNWHHRGAAYFWQSKTLENLFDTEAALDAAYKSLYCWAKQIIIDPGTERHKQQLENAVKRVRELT